MWSSSPVSSAWLSKPDTPGVDSLGVDPQGLAVLAMLVHVGRREWRAATSVDLDDAEPVRSIEELELYVSKRSARPVPDLAGAAAVWVTIVEPRPPGSP